MSDGGVFGVRDALEGLPGESQTDSSKEASQAMQWLFDSGAESYSDVTVRCDGGSLYLHRNILMARSGLLTC